MPDAVQSEEYYHDDEFLPKSPLLRARFAKTPQSTTPPPLVATSDYSSGLNGSNIPRLQDEENLNRRKKDVKVRTRPTQGDWVLIREMDPNRPDIAQQAIEAVPKAAEEQQQSHQKRNIRHPKHSSDYVLEHPSASLLSTPLSSRPVSSRQPIIIQSSPPINQQSSTALAPPADASVATSHNEGPPHRGLSRNIADQGEDVPHVGSLPQSALKDKTQEISKASTERISRRPTLPSSSQVPRRTTYDPNAPAPVPRRHNVRPEIHLSQSARDVNRPSQQDTRSMRPDPTPYYPDQRQSYYSHAGVVVQPATTRPRHHSASRPVSYSGEPGPQYHWPHGGPWGYSDPRPPIKEDVPSKRGVVVTQASTEAHKKGSIITGNRNNHDSSTNQKRQGKRMDTIAAKDHMNAAEDGRNAKGPSDLEEEMLPVHQGAIMADVNGDPYALKSSEVKACADCRKSKRRCIHDEYGNVDPVKANEIPIPRGSASTNMDLRSDSGYSSYVPPRPSSPRSDVAVYGESDTKSIPTHGQASDSGKNEIRLRVDANTPLSFQLNGDMEGRTMQLIPGKDGMAELVISGNGADPYRAEQERRRQKVNSRVYYQPPTAFDSSSEGDFEGVEAPEAQMLRRRRVKDKDSREHRDHVVPKARQDETTSIEYTNSQRGTDVPLDDSMPRALKRVSKRRSVLDSGEEGEKIYNENHEDDMQLRTQALYNGPGFRPVQGDRPSSGNYSARYETARSDLSYYNPRHSPHRVVDLDPGTRRRLRRPSVTEPMSYPGGPGPQYHWPEQPRSGRRPSHSSFSNDRVIQSAPINQTLTSLRGNAPLSRQLANGPSNLSQSSHIHHVPAQQTNNRLPQEESETQTDGDAAKAKQENKRHVRFELGLADSRAKEKAGKHLAEREKDRAAAREESRHLRDEEHRLKERERLRQEQRDLEKAARDRKEERAITTPPDSSDDEEYGRSSIENLRALQQALQHINQKRILSPTRETTESLKQIRPSDIEPDSPVLMTPVLKDPQNTQKTNDSGLKVEEEETKRTLSAGGEEVLQKSPEVQMDAPVGLFGTLLTSTSSARGRSKLAKSIIERDYPSDTDRTRSASPPNSVYDTAKRVATPNMRMNTLLNEDGPGNNKSLAMDVEKYTDANPKHRGLVAYLKRSTSALALENSATNVHMDDTIQSGRESVLPILEYDPVNVWLGAGSINFPESYHGWNYESTPSGPSSYAASVASVFSVASLASSASDISKGSGYSAVQIATATKVLLSVFYEDKTLLSLYKSAIGNENIGPERLQRNLRRLFRAYAGLLESEATERLEHLSSRLVLAKSAFLAESIVEKLQNGRVGAQSPRSERDEESSDEEDDNTDTHLVNEDAFEDLAIFREFLVESDAFRTFRDQLEAFVLPKPIYLTHEEPISKREAPKATTMEPVPTKAVSRYGDVLTWQKWRRDAKLSTDGLFHGAYLETTATSLFHLMMDAIFLATDDLLIAAGRLERPLSPNMVRLRWQCACGDPLHSDVSELRKGGIEELISHMQRTSGAKVVASPHSHQSGNQKYVMPNPTQWIQKAFTSILGGSAKKSAACLPQHNTPCTSTTTANALPPQRSILHLLACMHRNRLRKDLKQDRIEDITTDRALLCFLRKQYRLHRGRFLHALSLQSVKGISFVKFRLPIGGSVDVRHHDPCCVADTTGPKTCECIPPPPKVEPSPGAEYRCIPGPPATYPPIPPVYLASLFSCPTDVHEKDTWILDQLPKRTCGELKGQIGQPAEGWGIYYDEGLDGDMLAWTILIVFLVASLLFGVLWSKFQYDIQGAFGVSAYMVACCAAVLPVIVTKLGNKG